MRISLLAAVLLAASAAIPQAQTPVPFPRPGQTQTAPPKSVPSQPPAPRPAPAGAPQQPAGEPTEATLGVPLYPGSQFVASFDAGKGQRYYLFGVNTDFAQVVGYYRTTLKTRGELVFEQPPVHMFDIGRFREETMAFPPSVTVKDYTWAGSEGYLNPKPGVEPARFRTIIQIVPAPPPVSGR